MKVVLSNGASRYVPSRRKALLWFAVQVAKHGESLKATIIGDKPIRLSVGASGRIVEK